MVGDGLTTVHTFTAFNKRRGGHMQGHEGHPGYDHGISGLVSPLLYV